MITGGTSGIGFAIAERFLQEGARRVVLVGRSYKRLLGAASKLGHSPSESVLSSRMESTGALRSEAETATRGSELVDEDGLHARLSTAAGNADSADAPGAFVRLVSARIGLLVGDISEASSWMRKLEREMENVDILVNAAGVSINGVLARTEPADISQVLRTNLEGSLLMSRALMRATIRSRLKSRTKPGASSAQRPRSKCIINVSSLLALKGGSGAVAYAASKAGILGLTRAIAVEGARPLGDVVVRSNAIVPGYIETPMIADFSPGESAKLKDSIPLRRFGDPGEVADAAVFLAQNEYANNCVLNIDGGLSAV